MSKKKHTPSGKSGGAKKAIAFSAPQSKPSSPPRSEIKPQVEALFDRLRNVGWIEYPLPTEEKHSLRGDYAMSEELIQQMAIPYTRISTQYEKGKTVTRSNAKACETVGNAVDIVHKRANGK